MKMMKFASAALVAAVLSAGCSSSGDKDGEREAGNLYQESYALVKSYTDSLSKAADSAAVARLSEHFEDRITRLNFKYKADTDLEMTEQENDTLSVLLERYVIARDSRLKKLHLATDTIKGEAKPDSLRADK